ncbi:MAG TPA: hypothetical protein VFV19_10090 [Candidatus Polarisedimenticolaceae bacterium]|nr:hypothetical protein [Candidatus Polarisedimenticolaceae bacterium]
MLDRRAFLSCVIVLGVAAGGAAHAGIGRADAVAQPAASSAHAPLPMLSVPATQRAWHRVLATYGSLLGLGGMHFVVLPEEPTIEGIQDGPDGVDPLGIKGFKGLQPKYQDDPNPSR